MIVSNGMGLFIADMVENVINPGGFSRKNKLGFSNQEW